MLDFLFSFLSLDLLLDLPQIGGDLARSQQWPASSSSEDESRINCLRRFNVLSMKNSLY
jgi:hypothetical protein